jgi:hypothetical protein
MSKAQKEVLIWSAMITILVVVLSFFVGTVNWSNVWYWTWRTAVGIALLAFVAWIVIDGNRRTKAGVIITHKWFKKFASWSIFALVMIFIVWPWLNKKYEEYGMAEVAQAQAQAEYLRTHPSFSSDTTFYFVARPNTFGKSWTLPREVWRGYTMEINAEQLDVPYIIATQAQVDTILPSSRTINLGMVRTLAFKTLRDSSLKVGVRFYRY